MSLFDKFMIFATTRGDTPTPYGFFHIAMLIATIIAGVLLCRLVNSGSDRCFRRVMLFLWVVLVVGEIYRQLTFAFDYSDNAVSWDYAWYQFPFQICSAPLYTLPFIAFLPEGRVRRAFMSYMAIFSFFGGAAVMLYPSDIFCSFVGINYQATIHHGLQAVIGLICVIRLHRRFSPRVLVSAVTVFACVVSIAMALNLIMPEVIPAIKDGATFNMLFISPYHGCGLPVIGLIRDIAPYGVFLTCYILGFATIGLIIYLAQLGIIRLCSKRSEKSELTAADSAV